MAMEAKDSDLETLKRIIFLGDVNGLKLGVAKAPYATLGAVDSSSFNLIHWAAYCDEDQALAILYEQHPFMLSAVTKDGSTALHVAAMQRSLRVIRWLAKIPDIIVLAMKVNHYGETALHNAAAIGDVETVRVLVGCNSEALATRDRWGRTPYAIAVENGYSASIIDTLKGEGIEHNISPEHSCEKEPRLISQIAQPSITEEFMQLLEKKKKSLSSASDIVVKHMFSTTTESVSPPQPIKHISAKMALSKKIEYPGDLEAIKAMLLEPDIDASGKDSFGLAAIHKFACWNKSDALDVLLEKLTSDDEVNIVNKVNGYTALHYCVEEGAERALERLLSDKRVDKLVRNKAGKTAYELAVELNRESMAVKLR